MSNEKLEAGLTSHLTQELGFKLGAGTVTFDDAITCANELENFIGGVLNGKLKAKNLPLEPLAKLVQFARDVVKKEQQSDAMVDDDWRSEREKLEDEAREADRWRFLQDD